MCTVDLIFKQICKLCALELMAEKLSIFSCFISCKYQNQPSLLIPGVFNRIFRDSACLYFFLLILILPLAPCQRVSLFKLGLILPANNRVRLQAKNVLTRLYSHLSPLLCQSHWYVAHCVWCLICTLSELTKNLAMWHLPQGLSFL